MRSNKQAILIGFAACAIATTAYGDTVLELRPAFIEKYKDRLTIDCPYLVDAAHKRPNPPAKDGDMHIAGRCPEVGLHIVAEIQNAGKEDAAVNAVHDAEGTGHSVQVVGVWRIWPEHGGNETHVQASGAGPEWTDAPPTNPPHVFEIHPVTEFNGIDLIGSLKPVDGFDAHTADESFQAYEASNFGLSTNHGKVQMTMRMVGFNYVNFVMQLLDHEKTASDGEFVYGAIRDDNNELLVNKRRIGFVKGSEPFAVEQAMTKGQCVKLLGIPRVDLALVSWRMSHAKSRPEVLKWGMPYEIIAVGVEGQPFDCGDQ